MKGRRMRENENDKEKKGVWWAVAVVYAVGGRELEGRMRKGGGRVERTGERRRRLGDRRARAVEKGSSQMAGRRSAESRGGARRVKGHWTRIGWEIGRR